MWATYRWGNLNERDHPLTRGDKVLTNEDDLKFRRRNTTIKRYKSIQIESKCIKLREIEAVYWCFIERQHTAEVNGKGSKIVVSHKTAIDSRFNQNCFYPIRKLKISLSLCRIT